MKTRIKELREQHGLGQETLASFVGSSQQSISRVEREQCVTSADLIVNIAKHFNVTTDYILCLSNTRRSLEGQLKVNQEIDEYYDIVSAYQKLNMANKVTIKILMNRFIEVQKEGN